MHIYGQGTPEWWIAIDTNSYAGNFERNMGAWCVGVSLEDRGAYEADLFREAFVNDIWARNLCDAVVGIGDDTYFTIGSNKDPMKTNTVYMAWAKRPTRKELNFILARACSYAANVRSGFFDDKDTMSKYTDRNLEVLGVRAVQARTSFKTTSSIGLVKTKKYQRKKQKQKP